MASVEVTFYRGTPHDNFGLVPIVGYEIATVDLAYDTSGGSVTIPTEASIAVMALPIAARIRVTPFTWPANDRAPSRVTPKNRLLPAGVVLYLGVPGGGTFSLLQEA